MKLNKCSFISPIALGRILDEIRNKYNLDIEIQHVIWESIRIHVEKIALLGVIRNIIWRKYTHKED